MHGFDRNPPAACSRIRAALEANGCRREGAPEIGSMARALAASKAAGTFLCIGEGAGEIGAWVLDGMDFSSGLVVLVQDPEEAAVLECELDRDVRASVHLQEAASFLIDVNAHRFDLIVDLIAEQHPQIVQLGLSLLRLGGVYLASHFGDSLHDAFTQCVPKSQGRQAAIGPDDFAVAALGDDRAASIIVRRAGRIQPKHHPRSKIR
jgi:predicted O-methyltransferase YrrM